MPKPPPSWWSTFSLWRPRCLSAMSVVHCFFTKSVHILKLPRWNPPSRLAKPQNSKSERCAGVTILWDYCCGQKNTKLVRSCTWLKPSLNCTVWGSAVFSVEGLVSEVWILWIADRGITVRITCCHTKTHTHTQAFHPAWVWRRAIVHLSLTLLLNRFNYPCEYLSIQV